MFGPQLGMVLGTLRGRPSPTGLSLGGMHSRVTSGPQFSAPLCFLSALSFYHTPGLCDRLNESPETVEGECGLRPPK